MTVVAATLIKAILQEDVVQAAEADLEDDEVVDTTFALNNYMFELAADGINLGFTEVVTLADVITVERGAINGIIKNVALQIAIQFGVPVPPLLERQAANGLRIMTGIAVSIPATPFPSTLPVGSGNECGTSARFFGTDEATILTEKELVIIPEANTELP